MPRGRADGLEQAKRPATPPGPLVATRELLSGCRPQPRATIYSKTGRHFDFLPGVYHDVIALRPGDIVEQQLEHHLAFGLPG